ncbi:MAG TPA: STAS domain-containing protein [Solirubrobacteraceae bacterium]|nr:STAS domain-containing protein [Solirubrobacteraceae bacterium]
MTETVALEGELDFGTAFDVEMRLEEAIRRADHVVVDLRGLSFIDSTGLGTLIEAHNRARREEVRLELIQGPPAVQQVFAVSGLLSELPFADDSVSGR